MFNQNDLEAAREFLARIGPDATDELRLNLPYLGTKGIALEALLEAAQETNDDYS